MAISASWIDEKGNIDEKGREKKWILRMEMLVNLDFYFYFGRKMEILEMEENKVYKDTETRQVVHNFCEVFVGF